MTLARSDENERPLSAFQAAMLLAHELEPESPAYHSAMPMRLRGPLDPAALERAFAELHRRHPSLRTTYHGRGAEAFQRVHETFEPLFLHHDATSLGDAALLQLVEADYRRPFDLTRGVIRASLYRRGPDEHVLLVAHYHICIDLASGDVFLDELFKLLEGRAPLPPPPAATYLDFVDWQQKFLRGRAAEQHLASWQRELQGVSGALDLPFDRPRPTVRKSSQAGSQTLVLDAALSAAVRSFGPNSFHTLLAAWVAFLYRLTRQSEILCGIPANARPEPRFEGVIGDFINFLPLRLRLEGATTFQALVGQVRSSVREAGARRDLPYLDLIRRLGRSADPSRAPLCETSFGMLQMKLLPEAAPHVLRGVPWRVERGALVAEDYPLAQEEGQLDLNLWMCESGGRFYGELKYVRDLFDDATVAQLARSFVQLCRSAAASPESALDSLALLEPSERSALSTIVAGPRTAVPPVCVHHLFEAQTDAAPSRIAVKTDAASITYGELEHRANRLAHRLVGLGLGPGKLAAVCLERTPDLLVVLLAVLKAGGAYLPLDPSYPIERLTFMLLDAGVAVAITESRFLTRLPGVPCPLVLLDQEVGAGPDARLESHATPLDDAYVIYTSGSTGKPKGVAVPHGAVVNFLLTMKESPGLTAADRLVAVTTLSFDIAVLELFLPLAVGAQVVLASHEAASSGSELAALLKREAATVLQATPATYRMLLEAGFAGGPGLRLFCGGERLSRELAAQLLPRCAELWNLYGPTETTIWSMRYRVPAGAGPVLLGEPIANTTLHVVDARLEPVLPGVPGELLIGGLGLARGYLHRPELNAACFVQFDGARVYRTGDLVRQRGERGIEYLGRLDHQVKVRGFRIELGEVETCLRRHPAVREAVVTARERHGEKQLVAYLVWVPGSKPSAGELRGFLKGALPEYMVPGAFVGLESLPLTPSGKIDRNALPEPVREAAQGGGTPPRTEIERKIAGILAAALGLDRELGVDEEFFSLGGDSLLAVRVLVSMEQVFDARLPLSAFLGAPTAEGLARALGADRSGHQSLLVPLRPGGTRTPLFCVHPLGGHVFCYAELARLLRPGRPVHGLRARGIEGEADPDDEIPQMAQRYLAEIQAAQPTGPVALVGWSMGGIVALELAQQLQAAGRSVRLLATIDAYWPAAFQKPPMLERLRARGVTGMAEWSLRKLLEVGTETAWAPTREEPLARVQAAARRASEQYVPSPYPGSVLFYQSSDQLPGLQSTLEVWEEVAGPRFEVLHTQGNHFEVLKLPAVRQVALSLDERLAAIDG